jgi:hypothetical protein
MRPIVSEALHQEGFRPAYKNGKQFAVCLSHDIDWLYEPKNKIQFATTFAKSLLTADLKSAAYSASNIVARKMKQEWSLARLLSIEESRKIPASYYFLSLSRGEEDFNYEIDEIKPYVRRILNCGGEIGLHGGHKAPADSAKINQEKAKLQRTLGVAVAGYRNHYLRFSTPTTWHHLVANGFKYDTTFGFADMLGYRNGMCYPFRPYDVENRCYIDLLEVPLIVMDVTFWKYLNLDFQTSFTLFCMVTEQVRRISGVLTVLWHNHSFQQGEDELYLKILDYLIEREPWFASTVDLIEHWRAHNLKDMERALGF